MWSLAGGLQRLRQQRGGKVIHHRRASGTVSNHSRKASVTAINPSIRAIGSPDFIPQALRPQTLFQRKAVESALAQHNKAMTCRIDLKVQQPRRLDLTPAEGREKPASAIPACQRPDNQALQARSPSPIF
ncbi:hypothetical protein IWX85_003607 [Polaromonas sp. CG_9.11]|nr:hypothetical protein [Polaromonas sp. CG_9.11]